MNPNWKMPTARTFVVGDVHGCIDELTALLAEAKVERNDELVFCGDLVAKGPDSQAVVQFARERKALCVLGNHDARVLQVGRSAQGPKHHEHVARTLREEDFAWLERVPFLLELKALNAIVAHGGLVPGVPLSEQQRDVVINLRSIDAAGVPHARILGDPWAAHWPGPQHVLFGHDAVRGLQQHPHATGLDTGCVYGRRLTGIWLPEHRLVSVPALKAWSPIENGYRF